MTISKSAARQAAKKPSRRNPVKNATAKRATAKRAMPLRTRDPVRKQQMNSHGNGAKPMQGRRPETNGGEGSTSYYQLMPSSELITMLMQWSPLGIFLRQQAFMADAMGQIARPNVRRSSSPAPNA